MPDLDEAVRTQIRKNDNATEWPWSVVVPAAFRVGLPVGR